MAIFFILGITAAVLAGLHLLPRNVRHLVGPHQWAAALILPLTATFGMAYAVFAGVTVAVIALAPAIGRAGLVVPPVKALELRAALFLFCLPIMPILTYTIAVSGLTFAQLTFVNLLAIGLVIAMLRANVPLRVSRLAVWDAIFVVMLIVQIFMDARGTTVTFSVRAALIIVFNLGLPYLAVSRAFARARQPGDLLLSLVFAGCVLAAMGAFESVRHWLLYDSMAFQIHADPDPFSAYTKQRDGLLRASVTFDESTSLSLLFGLQIVILVALRRHVGSWKAFTCIALMLAMGAMFTFARVGYIVIAVGLVACFFYERNWKNLTILALVMPIIVGVLLALATVVPAVAASIGTSADASGSVDYRSQLLTYGLAIVRDHWAIGLDLETITLLLEPLKTGEQIIDFVNQPLTILMRSGLIGGLLYFLILFCVLITLFNRRPRMPVEARGAGGACFAGLIGVIASLTTTSYGRNEITYVVLLAAGAGLLARKVPTGAPAWTVAGPLPRPAASFALQKPAMSVK